MNTYTITPVTERELRNGLRSKFGKRNYKILHNSLYHGGLVEVYGKMPNSNVDGWYILGAAYSVEVLNIIGFENPYA